MGERQSRPRQGVGLAFATTAIFYPPCQATRSDAEVAQVCTSKIVGMDRGGRLREEVEHPLPSKEPLMAHCCSYRGQAA